MWRDKQRTCVMHDRPAGATRGARPKMLELFMSSDAPDNDKGRILPFARRGKARTHNAPQGGPVEGLEKYADSEPDNYRQRMINNGLAFVACLVLVAIGVWLATTIAEMRRNQDCVLSGRRNCAQVNVLPADPSR